MLIPAQAAFNTEIIENALEMLVIPAINGEQGKKLFKK